VWANTEFLLLKLVVNILTNKLQYILFKDRTLLEIQSLCTSETQTEHKVFVVGIQTKVSGSIQFSSNIPIVAAELYNPQQHHQPKALFFLKPKILLYGILKC
jgi:hypothetical protein